MRTAPSSSCAPSLPHDSERVLRGALPLSHLPKYEIQHERENRCVVSERNDRLEEHSATNLRARYAHVRGLKAHPDRESEVGEIEVARLMFAWEFNATDAFGILAIVEVTVAKGENRLQERP